MCGVVIIKVRKRTAHDDSVRLELLDGISDLREVDGHRLRILNQPQHVPCDVITCHTRNLAFELELAFRGSVPIFEGELGDVRLVPQQILSLIHI